MGSAGIKCAKQSEATSPSRFRRCGVIFLIFLAMGKVLAAVVEQFQQ